MPPPPGLPPRAAVGARAQTALPLTPAASVIGVIGVIGAQFGSAIAGVAFAVVAYDLPVGSRPAQPAQAMR